MNLSRNSIAERKSNGIELPEKSLFDLPEKVLQFGTGVLLRGLPDYFIDKANKKGIFNGRIVVVKSTATSGADSFDKQDGLYTLCVRGIDKGKKASENIVNASISRVLSARNQWDEILRCAANPDMQIIISNTTEVGITLIKDNVHASPPESFPGKLLAFLYQRFKVFIGDISKGMIIVPTELIPDNGKKLEAIVLELAHQNGLETAFLDWLETSNHFCNSLVDRIVPGKLTTAQQQEMEKATGFSDELMIMSELYRLWAIESSDKNVNEILSFSDADEGVVIAPDINVFRELKLRLLNGSHTFSCGLAHLAGFKTVVQAMDDPAFANYITKLMMEEIAPAITSENLNIEQAKSFAEKVIDRYRNPYIEHLWLSITLQYSSKMKMRNLPVLAKYAGGTKAVPPCMSLGFASHLLFMKAEQDADGKYYGEANGTMYLVNDDNAAWYADKWSSLPVDELVDAVIADSQFWGFSLDTLPGFSASVKKDLKNLMNDGAAKVLQTEYVQKDEKLAQAN
ncbi:MAG: tagaturonate reductase [Gemmatimonadaceae bacterium]|nr:tagaturonate reductase [Chitinophagaceae bacterium]